MRPSGVENRGRLASPGALRDPTWAHQAASAAVFTAPLLTYAAHPTHILENPCAPLLKSIPAVWDETVVLPVSAIGEVAAFARRRGVWFLAILNGPAARSVKVPLSFLGPGEYRGLLIRDHKNEGAAVRSEATSAPRGDALTIDLSNGGGFSARYERA